MAYGFNDDRSKYQLNDATETSKGLMSAEDKAKLNGINPATYITNSQLNSLRGAASGLATLDSSGKVPESQLPSYVDDVLEYNSQSGFPLAGETGKIYVAKDTNLAYRWSGSAYIEISSPIALGETSGSAYRGDRGKIAYEHAMDSGVKLNSGLYKITTSNEGHVTAGTAVTKSDITALGIPGSDTTYENATTSTAGLMSAEDKAKLDALDENSGGGGGAGSSIILPGGESELELLQLGETSTTAYRGDRGKAAYDHASAKGTNLESGLYKITTNSEGHVTAGSEVTKSDITSLGIPGANTDTWTALVGATDEGDGTAGYVPAPPSTGYNTKYLRADGTWSVPPDTTYSNVTASSAGVGGTAGLMSAADKEKLDGIASSANATVIDSALSDSSENPVQNKVINTALGNKLATSLKGAANGLAELDANGFVPTSQLPSYVDDVIEGYFYNNAFYSDSTHETSITGATGKIYVDLSTNITYRWSGSAFVEISPSLALGENSSTAYRGDRGADAYAHAVTNKGTALASGMYKITTNSEGHVTAGSAILKDDITALGIPGSDTTYSNAVASTSGSGGSAGLMSATDKEKLDGLVQTVFFSTTFDGTNTSGYTTLPCVVINMTTGNMYLLQEASS